MKLVFNTKHVWYINSNETSQTQEQIIQLILVCLCFIEHVTEQEEACVKGMAIQNLKAREP